MTHKPHFQIRRNIKLMSFDLQHKPYIVHTHQTRNKLKKLTGKKKFSHVITSALHRVDREMFNKQCFQEITNNLSLQKLRLLLKLLLFEIKIFC